VQSKVEVNMNNIEIFNKNDDSHPLYVIALNELSDVKKSIKFPNCIKLEDQVNNHNSVRLCDSSPSLKPCDQWIEKIIDFKKKCSNQILDEISKNSIPVIDPLIKLKYFADKFNLKANEESKLKEQSLDGKFREFKKQTKELLDKEEAYENQLLKSEKDRLQGSENNMIKELELEQKIKKKILAEMALQNPPAAAVQAPTPGPSAVVSGLIADFLKNSQGPQNVRNPMQCFQNSFDNYFVQQYCNINYADEGLKVECLKKEQFCYMCCDKEIDIVLNKTGMECCYNKCDTIKPRIAGCPVF